MQLVSYQSKKGVDVIQRLIDQCIAKDLLPGNKKEVKEKLANKIWAHIEVFLEGPMVADGYRVEHLSGPVHEFRVSLPGANLLARIIFLLERGKLVLLTGSFIKPASYNDKKTTKQVDRLYETSVTKAKKIYRDRKGPQKLTYVEL